MKRYMYYTDETGIHYHDMIDNKTYDLDIDEEDLKLLKVSKWVEDYGYVKSLNSDTHGLKTKITIDGSRLDKVDLCPFYEAHDLRVDYIEELIIENNYKALLTYRGNKPIVVNSLKVDEGTDLSLIVSSMGSITLRTSVETLRKLSSLYMMESTYLIVEEFNNNEYVEIPRLSVNQIRVYCSTFDINNLRSIDGKTCVNLITANLVGIPELLDTSTSIKSHISVSESVVDNVKVVVEKEMLARGFERVGNRNWKSDKTLLRLGFYTNRAVPDYTTMYKNQQDVYVIQVERVHNTRGSLKVIKGYVF